VTKNVKHETPLIGERSSLKFLDTVGTPPNAMRSSGQQLRGKSNKRDTSSGDGIAYFSELGARAGASIGQKLLSLLLPRFKQKR
jgi:hypothetical protein